MFVWCAYLHLWWSIYKIGIILWWKVVRTKVGIYGTSNLGKMCMYEKGLHFCLNTQNRWYNQEEGRGKKKSRKLRNQSWLIQKLNNVREKNKLSPFSLVYTTISVSFFYCVKFNIKWLGHKTLYCLANTKLLWI